MQKYLPSALLIPSSKKKKKKETALKKLLVFSQKKLLQISGIRTVLHFRKRNFVIFQGMETLQNFVYLRRELTKIKMKIGHSEKISYISGNGTS